MITFWSCYRRHALLYSQLSSLLRAQTPQNPCGPKYKETLEAGGVRGNGKWRSTDKGGSLLPGIKPGSLGSSAHPLRSPRGCVQTSGQLLHHEVARPGPAVPPALGGAGEVSASGGQITGPTGTQGCWPSLTRQGGPASCRPWWSKPGLHPVLGGQPLGMYEAAEQRGPILAGFKGAQRTDHLKMPKSSPDLLLCFELVWFFSSVQNQTEESQVYTGENEGGRGAGGLPEEN